MRSFDNQTLREQSERILEYIKSEPEQTLIPDGRVRLLEATLHVDEPRKPEVLTVRITRAVYGYAKYSDIGQIFAVKKEGNWWKVVYCDIRFRQSDCEIIPEIPEGYRLRRKWGKDEEKEIEFGDKIWNGQFWIEARWPGMRQGKDFIYITPIKEEEEEYLCEWNIKFCPKCGHPIGGNLQTLKQNCPEAKFHFCSACGVSLRIIPEEPTPDPSADCLPADSPEPYRAKKKRTFIEELTSLLNIQSEESGSNTPDFILAQYLEGCLRIYELAVQQRETWHGRDPRPSHIRYGVEMRKESV